MKIVRGLLPHDNYAMIPNSLLQDVRLSRGARGLLAEIASRPPGWETTAVVLARQGPEGEKKIRSYLRELHDVGYLERTRRRGLDGRFEWEMHVCLMPQPPAPTLFDED